MRKQKQLKGIKQIVSIKNNLATPNPERSNETLKDTSREGMTPIGLPNIGNTCFLNSIIQYLYAAKQTRKFLIQKYGKQSNMEGAKFSKLIGKLFFYLQQKSKEQNKIREILSIMVKQLESMNNQYTKYHQEDALQTLLSILLQIEQKHPNVTKIFDVQYMVTCKCSSYITKERVVSFWHILCGKCNCPTNRVFLCAPNYIIYSNSKKETISNEKSYSLQTISQAGAKQMHLLVYMLVAQIIYMGNGRSGHYIAHRLQQNKPYIFNDSSVSLIEGKNGMQSDPGQILLYQLKQKIICRQIQIQTNKIYLLKLWIFNPEAYQLQKKDIYVRFIKFGKKGSYHTQILNKNIDYYTPHNKGKLKDLYTQLQKLQRNRQQIFSQRIQHYLNTRIKSYQGMKKYTKSKQEIKFKAEQIIQIRYNKKQIAF